MQGGVDLSVPTAGQAVSGVFLTTPEMGGCCSSGRIPPWIGIEWPLSTRPDLGGRQHATARQ
jgi:hypothetical protein